MQDNQTRLAMSWNKNAILWTEAVDRGLIPSREAATNQAILNAARQLNPASILDMGCGEGWLTRALKAESDREIMGIDGSGPLVSEAVRRDPGGQYLHLDYGDIIRDPARLPGSYDLILFNFSLLDDGVAPLLTSLHGHLNSKGRILIQTLHPMAANADGNHQEGWRLEDFSAFRAEDSLWRPMPWYFRPIEGWMREVAQAGYLISEMRDTIHPETDQPLSMMMTLTRIS